MKQKAEFSSKIFFWIILIIVFSILFYNICTIILFGTILGLVLIITQSLLLFLIIIKHKYAKIGIKIWVSMFFITAYGLQVIGRFLQDISKGFDQITLKAYLPMFLMILVGVLIFYCTDKTVRIIDNDERSKE